MRDWNVNLVVETSKKPKVLILPMRDWNPDMSWWLECYKAVLILPMRDWNCYNISCRLDRPFCFDLTYEGLKYSSRLSPVAPVPTCFDLTYEGLKFVLPIQNKNVVQSFDLTYEGLKFRAMSTDDVRDVVFWSYLWGIEISYIGSAFRSS